MDYYVLKGRELREPISETNLRAELASGTLTPDDLVRPADGFFWTPLRKVLPANKADRKSVLDIPSGAPIEAPLPSDDWLDKPVRVGGICLGVGAIVLLLSPWPLLLYGPLLAAAFAAGVISIFKRRTGAGVLLCVGAILVPAVFNWFAAIVGPVESPASNAAAAAVPKADLAVDAGSASGSPQIAIATPVDEAPTPAPEAAPSNETPAPGAPPAPEKRASIALPKPVPPSASLPDPDRRKEKNK